MKVKELLKKYRMGSNADVFLQSSNGKFAKLERNEIENLIPEVLMDSAINTFEIIDNVLTIYIK